MGWAHCGKDKYGRYIGYGEVALCDHETCIENIDRGLAYVCGGMHGGRDHGCGRYFCEQHLFIACYEDMPYLCQDCIDDLDTTNLVPWDFEDVEQADENKTER